MPIDGYENIEQLLRLGHIRRGYQKQIRGRDGRPATTPVATPHFIVPPEVQEHLEQIDWVQKGENLTKLPIKLLFELPKALPHYLMRYSGNGKVRCKSDGKAVEYRRLVNQAEKRFDVVIHSQVARWSAIGEETLQEWQGEYGTVERYPDENGNTVRCLHRQCPQYQKRYCKPTGFLRLGISGISRQGYYQMVVHENALKPLLSQLRWAQDLVEGYTGEATLLHTPFVMTLRGPETQFIGGNKTQVWTPWVEIEEGWMKRLEEGRVMLPHRTKVRVVDIWPSNGDAPQDISEFDVPPEPEIMEELGYSPNGDEEIGEVG